jgi:hypothetical protein
MNVRVLSSSLDNLGFCEIGCSWCVGDVVALKGRKVSTSS